MGSIIMLTKKIHLLKKKFKKMIIEMLLNNDIKFFFCSNDFKLSR